MKGISLYFRDTGEKVFDFSPGAYVIGRGNRLKCNDKKISHNHALLTVTSEKVTLTPTHVNPCFFKPAAGLNLTILEQNAPVEIKDGDTFGLLPNEFWYKVKFCDEDVKTEVKEETEETERISDTDSNSYSKCDSISRNTSVEDVNQIFKKESRKREMIESNSESIKKLKISDVFTENKEAQAGLNSKSVILPQTSVSSLVSNSEKAQNSAVDVIIKQEDKDPVDQETDNEICDQNTEPTNDKLVSTENTTTEDDNQPSSSTTNETVPSKEKKKIRDRCWYGTSCYRKNPNHKKELSHPGDSDYESDENDDRPMCPFGVNCYRRNKVHREQYKHPKTQGIPKRPMQSNPSVFQFHNCNFYGPSFPFS